MKAFLHFIAALRSKKKTKYEGKMSILQAITKSLNHYEREVELQKGSIQEPIG